MSFTNNWGQDLLIYQEFTRTICYEVILLLFYTSRVKRNERSKHMKKSCGKRLDPIQEGRVEGTVGSYELR